MVSVLLCSLVHDSLERAVLPAHEQHAEEEETLLLHFVDDFLCVSTRAEPVERFVRATHAGVPELGCFMNAAKTAVSFPVLLDDSTLTHCDGQAHVPWCGMLLCAADLSCRTDFGKYAGSDLASRTATLVGRCGHGAALRAALVAVVKQRCTPLVLDSRLNGPGVVALNVHRAALFGALCLVAHVARLPVHNVRFLLRTVWHTASALAQHASSLAAAHHFACVLPRPHAVFLGLSAFALALKHHTEGEGGVTHGRAALRALLVRVEAALARLPHARELAERFRSTLEAPSTLELLRTIRINSGGSGAW